MLIVEEAEWCLGRRGSLPRGYSIAAERARELPLRHRDKYVEQGVEAVDLERLVAAEQAGAAFDASIAERSRIG
jgi:hypothetical protein